METVVTSARYPVVVFVALISVVAGGALLWGSLNPETIAAAHTAEILFVLGLLLLPAGTIAAFEFDRRRRAQRALAGLDAESTFDGVDRRALARQRSDGALTGIHPTRPSRRHRPNLPATRRGAGSQPLAGWRISPDD